MAEFALANARYAVAGATAVVAQPTDPPPGEIYGTQDGPYTDTYRSQIPPSRDELPPRYNCDPRGDAVETIANCNEVKDKQGGGGAFWKIALAIAVAILIGAIVKKTVFSSGNQSLSETTLLEQGPQLPVSYPDGSLAVRGFARDGWPIVVDFEPQPGTVTELQVKIEKRTQKFVLDAGGSRGRRIVEVIMPDTGRARNPRPATYLIASLPIASFDVAQPSGGGAKPAPLRILGIGGGPRAVGSVAIENVVFGRPAQAALGARFSYVAKSNFQRARAQVQAFQRTGDTIQIRPVFTTAQTNLPVGRQAGIWPGTDGGTAAPSRGPHRLQVTAWFTTDDRSWVAALAPDLITQ